MYVPGTDPKSKLLRQTLCRQCNLIAVLLLRSLSDSVRKRLQSLQDIVDAGKKFVTFEKIIKFIIN